MLDASRDEKTITTTPFGDSAQGQGRTAAVISAVRPAMMSGAVQIECQCEV
jgi:hypothetical protein